MRNDYSKNIKRKKILFGILFVLLGTALIINALGYIEIGNIFYFIVTLFLIPIFIKGIIHLNFSSILIPPAIVGCMYAKELGITSITPWPLLLCALFLSIGLHLIFGHRKNYKYNSTIERDDNNIINVDVNFNSVIKYVNAENLKSGLIDCSFGAAKVYFDQTKLSKNGATIELDVSFSGVELYIPKDWKIINQVNVFAGGIDERNTPVSNSENILTLTGVIHFSGITIIYV